MAGGDPRAALKRAASERGLSLESLSRALGRNPAYIQQWLVRGSPRLLAERDRRILSSLLDLSEEELGGPPAPPAPFALPRLDIRASAGPGSDAGEELLLGIDSVDPRLARALRLRPGKAGLIRVSGDSMAPQLLDGDELIVDTADRSPGATGRVYVIRIEGALMVKRVALADGRLVATSDNPEAAPVPEGDIELVGRVAWRMGAPQ